MNLPSHHEIPMGWEESVLSVLAGFPHYTTDDIQSIEVTSDGPVLVIKPNE